MKYFFFFIFLVIDAISCKTFLVETNSNETFSEVDTDFYEGQDFQQETLRRIRGCVTSAIGKVSVECV